MRLCGPSAPAGGTPFGRGCGRKDESKERPFFYGMAYARMSLDPTAFTFRLFPRAPPRQRLGSALVQVLGLTRHVWRPLALHRAISKAYGLIYGISYHATLITSTSTTVHDHVALRLYESSRPSESPQPPATTRQCGRPTFTVNTDVTRNTAIQPARASHSPRSNSPRPPQPSHTAHAHTAHAHSPHAHSPPLAALARSPPLSLAALAQLTQPRPRALHGPYMHMHMHMLSARACACSQRAPRWISD